MKTKFNKQTERWGIWEDATNTWLLFGNGKVAKFTSKQAAQVMIAHLLKN